MLSITLLSFSIFWEKTLCYYIETPHASDISEPETSPFSLFQITTDSVSETIQHGNEKLLLTGAGLKIKRAQPLSEKKYSGLLSPVH